LHDGCSRFYIQGDVINRYFHNLSSNRFAPDVIAHLIPKNAG
jgi:hypothetical protein